MREMFVYSTLWCYKAPIYFPIWRSERNGFIKYSLVHQGTYLLTNLVLREIFVYITLRCCKAPIYLPIWRSERNVTSSTVLFGATRYLMTFQTAILREMLYTVPFDATWYWLTFRTVILRDMFVYSTYRSFLGNCCVM